MNHDLYHRRHSSAWTGYAPRSTEERWPADPITPRASFWRRLLIWFCGF